ncbi:hypothetical protein B0O99DRAFT_17789 [Bisporella sp. PMI_857]|nr:hypothetical protein B0O99DRAFT_17789 [Bisporella sp. PMI_857]
MMQVQMQQPSDGIARELLPHIHLVSTHRYPLLPSLHHEKVAEWLLAAPKIANNSSPFYWTYLDRPQDGTFLLLWQSPSLGVDLPSDGYVWSPGEMRYQIPVSGGLTLEMYQQKVGYSPGEPVATHARRRYRLLPSQAPGAPQVDPSLWITHYSQCDPNERVSSQAIPITPQIQQTMQTRAYLQQQGQIVQKEFMLHDRHNWPQIQFPRAVARAPQLYSGNMPQARIPPSMAYPTQHPASAPPPKRVRTQGNPPNTLIPGGSVILEGDDEEDTSRGDLFDFTTPREISMARYKQNHEWMEEILSSPYSINQIIPADLGLGLRGELASLTDGFFDAPFDPDKDVAKNIYVGRLDPEKAEQFRQRVSERVADTNKEIEKMKAKHAKRLAKFKKSSLLSLAEKDLRTAVANPSDVGPEYWRLEGRIDEDDEEGKSSTQNSSKVDDILAQVEASIGRNAVAIQELRRIQDGGFEEAAPAPPSPQKSAMQSVSNGTPHSGATPNEADQMMQDTLASMAPLHGNSSSNATPGSGYPTPQAHIPAHSAAGTPGMHVPSPLTASHVSPQPQAQTIGDHSMTGAGDQGNSGDATGGDWVVVPPGGVTPEPVVSQPLPPPATTAPASVSHPTTSNNTPLPDFNASPNDFSELADLDTAGEALAGYGDNSGDMGDLDLDMDVGMDDSAFGEAFHGVEPREEEDNHGDGL